MSNQLDPADVAASERAAYIHIPFCRRRCPYCDFAVVDMSAAAGDVDGYVAAVRREIVMEPEWEPLHAVNFGGGTPSALAPGMIASMLDTVRNRFGLVSGAEVSIEANPEDWDLAYAEAMVEAGITRVSLGVQSFAAEVLRYLGREHRPERGGEAVAAAVNAGVGSVSLDLIFGSPVESFDSWRDTVATALTLEPHHVSVYALTVERGTALSRSIEAGAAAPDDDDQADKYEHFAATAGVAGLGHYEISNWAQPGHECRYNQTTWAHGEYIAFGVGAHGYRDGVRTRNVRRLDRYLESIADGSRPLAGSENLVGWERERERLFVGLRRRSGVVAGELGRAFAESAAGRKLADTGVIRMDGDRLVVVNPLLADAAARELLAFTPTD